MSPIGHAVVGHGHTPAPGRLASDAAVFMLPECNYTTAPPSLFNALDCLHKQWNDNPAIFVSYGNISGGIRSDGIAKRFLAAMAIMPVKRQMMIPRAGDHLEAGVWAVVRVQRGAGSNARIVCHACLVDRRR